MTIRGRVLVVDDDESVLYAHRRALTGAGFAVETAGDGASAAQQFAAGFDCVVTDLEMPGLNGLQLMRQVRSKDLEVPVILVTGQPSLATALNAIELGAMRYLVKPALPSELIASVTDAVRLRRLAAAKRDALAIVGAASGLAGDRAGLEVAFARVLESLWMAFQPIVSVPQRRVFGYEALLRSTDPALPHAGAILDAAERLRRVHDLGRVIRARVAAAAAGAPDDVVFFVNLHSLDLLDEALTSPDAPLTRLAPRVMLEITERASLDEVTNLRDRIAGLRRLGFKIAVDDLGAGYAGMTSFANLEPELVKIDLALVRGIDESPIKRTVVSRLTELSHELGITVVAEGIETVAERDTLVALGCDLLQGFLFAKPGPAFPAPSWPG